MQNYNSNNPQKSFFDCNDKSPLNDIIPNVDQPQKLCEDLDPCNTTNIQSPDLSWLEDYTNQMTGFGSGKACDPMMTGSIVNDTDNPNSNTIYRYSNAIRGADEAMLEMFRNIVCLDINGHAKRIPIIWGSQEKAVAYVMQDNVRKDNSLVVDRIRLPILSLVNTGVSYNMERYTYHKATDYLRYLRDDNKPGWTRSEKQQRDTIFGKAKGIPVDITYSLYAWTLYLEDMNQILEQIYPKFSSIGYINIKGINWEIPVKLDSSGNNIENEPGDQALRVIKYQFDMTVESYIPQPIVRKKAILSTKVELVNQSEHEVTELIKNIEESIKGTNARD